MIMRLRFALLTTILALGCAAPASAEWNEAISKHFHVYADETPDELRAFATKLERFDAAVREARGAPDVDAGASTQVTVYVLPDINAVEELSGEEGVAGFYAPRASGSVAFVPHRGRSGEYDVSADSVFFHEYTHHLMLEDTDRPLPQWLEEGFAEFFANPIFNEDGSVTIGAPPKYRAKALYDQAMAGLPLNKMLSGDFTSITWSELGSIYGRGWLLTHLLSFDLKRRGQLTSYLDQIAQGTPPLKAAQNAFGDLKVLDRELYDYFKADKFTVATIPASKLHLPPIEVRPLSPALAELMDSEIKFASESHRFSASGLASKARGIVEKYPNDVRALTLLAEMEDAADEYDAASRDADAALKLDPKAQKAMMAKGSALMGLAKQNPKAANWDAIRAYFSSANRLDVEDAEPLVLFYRSYVAQGITPSSNAMDGLQYALLLAPQDTKLRLEAVGEYLREGKLTEAHDVLVPVAYSPHAGKAHDAVYAIMDRIDAKDTAGALTAWAAAKKMYDKAG